MAASNHNVTSQDLPNGASGLSPRHPDSRLETDWLFLYDQLPPTDWFKADYVYKTSGWLNIHADIRQRQRTLIEISGAYRMNNLEWSAYRTQTLPRINQYILKLHHHHNIEDQAYFPTFIRMYPQLKAGFEILDRDHVHLDALLNELQALNGHLAKSDVEDKALTEQLHQTLVNVSVLLSQHLTDEEDLVIPILGLN
ncbi:MULTISPECIES: hemerythrin domain-containing protein [Psychrobacter]|uniref:hemerythrin domain-containing protein n=1 Tax=Psychrobacter TaxID=497 RepID=UPI000EF09841|nr:MULTISPECIES: hemerythrin domain-containing protein [Psychrobacter]HCT74284.1 hemerythrin [Psychrobacter sp.]